MAYVPTTFVDRSVEFPSRRKLTAVSGLADTFDVARAEGTVFVEGTKPDAANLNAEFGKIKTETDAINIGLNAINTSLNNKLLYQGDEITSITVQEKGKYRVFVSTLNMTNDVIYVYIKKNGEILKNLYIAPQWMSGSTEYIMDCEIGDVVSLDVNNNVSLPKDYTQIIIEKYSN